MTFYVRHLSSFRWFIKRLEDHVTKTIQLSIARYSKGSWGAVRVRNRLLAKMLHNTFREKIEKRQHFFTFMEKVFQRCAAKIAHILEERQEVWYLLIFGVYHPKKPDQKHWVFDLSSLYKGTPLNSVLLTESNLINNIVGVLRFFCNINRYWADVLLIFYMRRPQGHVTLPMVPEQ